ncbi:PLDc N-terminal domain-containing protein [Microbacterium sp. MPKO10]|uniref:PLDc N-terminal domain-containing protein n=1 Tax=Microbacterium sp. MPKO10 TaxID=2989818 RepID=UPI0022354E3A|nr:PLDc N-terminal domain-containing protein [Microbacterium sp. MPKO10]MCW4457175.1 PLDc N-terminal domain-containing protein [Microbacterium sp. MPKO10]
MNPTLPVAYDIAWSASIVVWVAIAVFFCVKVVRDQTLTPGSKLLWVIVIVCAPVVGVIAWFASADWRRRSQPLTAHSERESQSVR